VIVNPDRFIGEIWGIEAILAQDVMIMNPARFAPVIAMARVRPRAVARCFPARADRGAP
jgi:hypothetical protein